jgi:nucleotide-binding universal stress UspA family protein
MPYKTILLHCNDRRRIEPLLAATVPLAERFQAHVLGLSIVPPVAIISTHAALGSPMVIDTHCRLYRAENPVLKSAFKSATRDRALSAEWREDEADAFGVAKRVVQYARAADLVVASQTDPQWPGSERLDVADRLAIESGRPVLIVPNAGTHDRIGEQVLIAWNARREAARAVFDALPLLQGAKDVKVVCVNAQSERERAEDVRAADLCAGLVRHGVRCEAIELATPHEGVGETLLACAKEFEADTLVMGCYGHARLREFIFGGASRHVLAHMSVAVLMSH